MRGHCLERAPCRRLDAAGNQPVYHALWPRVPPIDRVTNALPQPPSINGPSWCHCFFTSPIKCTHNNVIWFPAPFLLLLLFHRWCMRARHWHQACAHLARSPCVLLKENIYSLDCIKIVSIKHTLEAFWGNKVLLPLVYYTKYICSRVASKSELVKVSENITYFPFFLKIKYFFGVNNFIFRNSWLH